MKILVHTRFPPETGGIETVAHLLAREWHRLGETVTVVSDVKCGGKPQQEFPFAVHYRPGPVRWLRLVQSADVFVHMNISLKAYWPLLLIRRPFVAVHHTYYHSDLGRRAPWRERLKLRLLDRATNVAISQFVASRIPAPCVVILNPVDLALYLTDMSVPREKDLVFLGRLVSDKGAALLISSVARLRAAGIKPHLTIIGDGPERRHIEKLVRDEKLTDRVVFAGRPTSAEVARTLQRHRLMVVPSIAGESFGVVALEGAASGCFVLGSDNGGLPEAIGPAGSTFRCGDIDDLTKKLSRLLREGAAATIDREQVAQHLMKHEPQLVAKRYLKVFRTATQRL